MKSSISRFPLTRRQTMHRQDGRQEIDRRTLLARGAAFAALLVTGCARKESRGFAAMSLRQLRARLERHVEPGFAPGMVGLVATDPKSRRSCSARWRSATAWRSARARSRAWIDRTQRAFPAIHRLRTLRSVAGTPASSLLERRACAQSLRLRRYRLRWHRRPALWRFGSGGLRGGVPRWVRAVPLR